MGRRSWRGFGVSIVRERGMGPFAVWYFLVGTCKFLACTQRITLYDIAAQ